ncbi:MAG TPA: EthD family reductase [Gemmatimonadaceae bacterium]|nr:EthD family reductase [Gemmatimonadaceae bacterium]
MFCVVVLYNHPKDPAAFEKYYAATHLPLVSKHAKAIGFTRAVLMKFPRNLDGSKPGYYRKAELWFDSEAALTRGTATPGFAAVAGDLPNFATGGFAALVGEET